VGVLGGAPRLGLELDYWGESVTRDFLRQVADKVPAGTVIEVAPVLHQYQLDEMKTQSPVLRRHGIELRAFTGNVPGHAPYLLVFRRLADLSPATRAQIDADQPIVEVRRSGVLLAALYDRRGR
jgi:hypothetical protein